MNKKKVNIDALEIYRKDLSSCVPIPADEEMVVAHAAQKGDRQARDKLITSNMRFAMKIAISYQDTGVDIQDLISAANYGLVKAADHYDPDTGNKFISYAVWWVRQSILETIKKHERLIRLPNRWIDILKYMREYHEEVPEAVSIEEYIAEKMDNIMDVSTIKEAIQKLPRSIISFDKPSDINGVSDLYNAIPDKEVTLPDEAVIEKDLKRHVADALNTLTQREKGIIFAYFGIGNSKTPMTMTRIGRKLGLSRERIRQIIKTSLNKLRHPGTGRRLAAYADEEDAYVWDGAKKEYTWHRFQSLRSASGRYRLAESKDK